MQATQTPVVWTVIICSLVLLVAGFMMVSSAKNAMPETPVINVPTAAEIASLISVPAAPEAIVSGDSQTVLCGLYDHECDDLESDVQNAMWDEYDEDYMDTIRDLIEDNEGEDIEDGTLSIYEWNYRDSYDFDVINLGLDDEEARAGEFEVTFRVEYKLEDSGDVFYDKVYVTGSASDWDKRDGEFDTVEATFSL